jgi:4-alpha-glucanotransferase
MPEYGVYHYKVLLFEKKAMAASVAQNITERRSIATITTHDPRHCAATGKVAISNCAID